MKLLTIVIIVLTAFLATSVSSTYINPHFKEDIDNFVKSVFLPTNRNTSLAITITNNESVLYSTGYGYMDVENEIPAKNDTEYLIGSISKSFTAIIVVKTLHEKFPNMDIETALNTPVRKLAPQLNFTLNDRYRSEQGTFRDMLSHRICSKPDGLATLTLPFKSAQELGYRQRYAEEGCSFRTANLYNNGMYALISSAIESVAGKPYHTLLLELLNDLGMDGTTFVKDDDADVMPNRAIPYYFWDGERHRTNPKLMKRVSVETSAGGVVSSAVDMSKYLQFFLNKGRVGDRQIVPENVLASLYKTAIPFYLPLDGSLENGKSNAFYFGYGLGLFQGVIDGWQRLGHSGSVPPFQSDMSFYPSLNLGIYSSTNQMPFSSELGHAQLHNAIFRIMQGENITSTNNFSKSKDPLNDIRTKATETVICQRQEPLLKKKTLNELIGSYGNGLQGELDITLRFRNETNSTELYMNWGAWGQAYLIEPDTNLKFKIVWDSDIIHDGYAMGMVIDSYVVFKENGTSLEIIYADETEGVFHKGVYLGGLPAVPWSPESCGPEI